MLRQWGSCQNEHEICIADVAIDFYSRGFDVYLEHEIQLGYGKRKRLDVDIYAKKGDESVIIEVGTLAERKEFEPYGRIGFLKKLMPQAKIIHVTQWKNFIYQFDWKRGFDDWYFEKYVEPNQEEWIREMGESLAKRKE